MVICYWHYGNNMVGNKQSVKYLKFFPKLHKMLVVHSQHSIAPKSKCIFSVLSMKLVIFFLIVVTRGSYPTFPHEINLSHMSIYLNIIRNIQREIIDIPDLSTKVKTQNAEKIIYNKIIFIIFYFENERLCISLIIRL